MADRIFEILRVHFSTHGYLTVFVALLLENAGVPVPGETVLLFASFLAYSQHELRLPFIILVATCAATLGDNIGYWIGHRGGRPLLDRYKHIFRIPQRTIDHGEELFRRHGHLTIFLARFIFGMRIIAGPLAGVLCMHWETFALYNFLGAVTWVTVITTVGYVFGSNWAWLVKVIGRLNIVIAAVAIALIVFAWRRYRERRG